MATNYEFLRVVGEHYNEIINCFKINAQALKTNFYEDTFHDTIIKCSETYKDDTNDYKKVKAYLWVAYKTNVLNKMQRTKHMECFEELQDFDIIDEEYIPEMDELYEIVKQELYDEFGTDIVDLWFEHVCDDKTYEEIEEKSGITNIHYQFKKIRIFIRNVMAKKSTHFKELLIAIERKI